MVGWYAALLIDGHVLDGVAIQDYPFPSLKGIIIVGKQVGKEDR